MPSNKTARVAAKPVDAERPSAKGAEKKPAAHKAKAAKRGAGAGTPMAPRAEKPSASSLLKRLAGSPRKAGFRLRRFGEGRRAIRKRRLTPNQQVLCLIWLLPVGIPMMWSRRCTWHRAVKLGVSALAMALMVALVLLPLPSANRDITGGVELVSSENLAEIYGPDLPTYIVPGYTEEKSESVIVDVAESNVHYVYAADGAKCYHEYECKFAYASSQRLTVYEAYYLGFTPCPRCNPPAYTGVL